ncbi:MAG TPA: FAD binding domain-containing protein [Stellaceae bacterium]|nr:FAD binding domain-containing protein [Stellaceae bacterium]
MKAAEFDYAAAGSVAEACRLLAGAGGDGKIIAGGQTLVPLMAMRLVRPALLVDINGIAALRGVAAADGHLGIGAGTRQADALADPVLRRRLPLLAKALGFVGHVQTRNRGTVGGSLAHADPAAEICLVAATLEAELVARSTAGERRIAARDFFAGAMTTTLGPEECLVAAHFPLWREERLGTGFQETSIRRSDFALAAAAAQLVLDARGVCRRAALGLGGAAATPLRLEAAAERLIGTRLEPADIAAARVLAEAAVEPISDLHASAEHRRRVAGAMVERALAEARQAAGA